MGVKFARAFGAHVVLFTTSPGKVEDGDAARRARGRGLEGRRRDERSTRQRSTSSSTRSRPSTTSTPTSTLLKLDGTLTLVGAPEQPLPVGAFSLLMRTPSASPARRIGGIAETQEMLDFCAEHGIVSDIEMIRIQEINEAYERMLQERREVPLRHRHGVAQGLEANDACAPAGTGRLRHVGRISLPRFCWQRRRPS